MPHLPTEFDLLYNLHRIVCPPPPTPVEWAPTKPVGLRLTRQGGGLSLEQWSAVAASGAKQQQQSKALRKANSRRGKVGGRAGVVLAGIMFCNLLRMARSEG